ncbi:MAG: serine/threonine-protein phosphatase [Phycisphaerales bacterium]|nr:serine/threonine-protein phosphatase [Phycisphaerales bacterium]
MAEDSVAFDAAAIILPEDSADSAQPVLLGALADLTRFRIGTLVWGNAGLAASSSDGLLDGVPANATCEEVVGRLAAIAHQAPLIRRMGREIDNLHRLGAQLNRYFSEIDQELRLAGRLQRDFLPREYPSVQGLAFGATYRPASWVSGDFYDLFRLDEEHVAFFIADAMGHGLAAGLLTMFLRQALITKRVSGREYALIDPANVVASLNESLLSARLPSQQFVTAVYGTVNPRSGEVRLSRAGHPYPILFRADGTLEELRSDGALLGVADVGDEFPELRFTLNPGEKILLYTDGIEELLVDPREDSDAPPRFTSLVHGWRGLRAEQVIAGLNRHLDRQTGSLHPADDVTAVAIERVAD